MIMMMDFPWRHMSHKNVSKTTVLPCESRNAGLAGGFATEANQIGMKIRKIETTSE